MASLVSNRGELFPLPLETGKLARAWKEFTDGVRAEVANATAGVAAARSAGSGLASSNGNTGGWVDKIVQGQRDADPDRELRIAAGASANVPGTSQALSDARSKADDPNTEPGTVDYDEAVRVAEREANGIEADANGLRGYELPPGPGGEGPI